MTELVTDCPRCGAGSITFDLKSTTVIDEKYGWQHWYEAFCICRRCSRSTIFVLKERETGVYEFLKRAGGMEMAGIAVNSFVEVIRHIGPMAASKASPPEHIPEEIGAIFSEAATCLSVECYNAAGTMFRLCVDLATIQLLPAEDTNGLNRTIRRSLGLRLKWLFDNNRLPEALRDLSHCIKEDGNDGAHEGTLEKIDAEDLLDFTTVLLERMFTEPRRIAIATERRSARRDPQA